MRGWGTALLLALLAGCGADAPSAPPRTTIGLSSSLPLVWRETGEIRGQLATDHAGPHWAMTVLSQRGRVVPLDSLADRHQRLPLPSAALLVLVQPKPLTPQENVALDGWVRGGGRLLLFADPMLTAHSDYALGDPRRPQAIVLLSPILRHWGLELQFDPEQPGGEREAEPFGVTVPVDLAGRFAVSPGVRCQLTAEGLAADCRIGKGRVIAVGDAAVFDGDDAGRSTAFGRLLALLTP